MRVLFTCLVFLYSMTLHLDGQEYSVMFYNVENLFDTSDDTTTNDAEFLPQGARRWTTYRYQRKLNAISRAVSAAGEWDLPSVIGLCEIENEEVVRDLAYGTILSAGNYGIVHRESPDLRGIDLAILYRRDRITLYDARSWVPYDTDGPGFTSRNLLYAKLGLGADTLHVILCHLPSRRGGVLAAERLRETMIRLAAGKADSVMKAGGISTAVMVMGDFNASPDDPLMSLFTTAAGLVNMAADRARQGAGSYRYQGMWEMIDQVMVSPALIDSAASFYAVPGSFRVIDAPFLMTDDETYPGQKPFPTYGGYRYAGGYSDHLPVMIQVRQEPDNQR